MTVPRLIGGTVCIMCAIGASHWFLEAWREPSWSNFGTGLVFGFFALLGALLARCDER